MMEVQSLEFRSRDAREVEGHYCSEASGRYRVAQQWRRMEVWLRAFVQGLARQAALELLQGELREQVVAE